jgi:hypothetical protein
MKDELPEQEIQLCQAELLCTFKCPKYQLTFRIEKEEIEDFDLSRFF